MPPQRSTPTARAVKTERTHEENQERAYIAASRRSDRSIEARVESARRASDIHKKRTGRALRVTEQDVINEDMYEEEDDDLPRQLRNMTSHLQTGSHDFNERLANYLIVHLGGSQAAQDFIKNTAQARPQMLQQPQSMAQRFLMPPSPDEQSAGVQHQMARHAAAIFGHQMPQQQFMNPGMGYMNPMQQGQMAPPQMTHQHQIANTPFNQPQQMQMPHFQQQQQQQPQFTLPGNMAQQQNQQQQHMMQRQNSRQMMQNIPIRGQVTSPPGSNGNFQTQPSPPAMTSQASNNGPRRSISASNTPLPSIEEPNAQPSPPNGTAGATVNSSSPPRVATAEPRASVAHMFVPQLNPQGRRPPSNIQMLGVNAGMIMPPQNQYTPNGINNLATDAPSQSTETTVVSGVDDNYDVDFLSDTDFINGSDALTDMFRMGGADAPWGDELHNSYVTGNDNDPFKLEHNDTMAPSQMNSSDMFISEWTADEYDAAAQ